MDGNVERMGRDACMVFMEKLEEREHFKDPGVDGRTILKWIFKKLNGGMDWNELRIW
jgi:hypothetical protein